MTGDRPRWAVRIQAERERRTWNKHEMARRLLKARGTRYPRVKAMVRQIYWWEAGRHFPRDWAAAYATAFGTTEADLFGHAARAGQADVADLLVAGITVKSSPRPETDDDVRRRAALELLAAFGVSAGALAATGEPIRQLLAATVDSEPRDLDQWHLTCADHLHAIRTRAPVQAAGALLVDLLAIQRQLQAAAAGEVTELRRLVAALSILYANALTRLGDHGAAIHWWRTARTAADATGDLDLRLMVRCEEAKFGLYGQRDLTTVLQLVDAAQMLAGDPPSFWLADLAGTRAKVLTRMGGHKEAAKSLNTFAGYTGEDGRAGIIPTLWNKDQVWFAASWVHAGAGHESAADSARDRVLAGADPDYQYVANVRLHEALCTVVNGGTDTGARQATEILAALPPSQHSHMITETGRNVLRAVPLDHRNRLAVQDLRALTSGHSGTAPR